MGNFLDKAKEEKDTEQIKTTEGIDIAATGMQGWRLEMEVGNRPPFPERIEKNT